MCTLMGHLGQLLLSITVFSSASRTFTSHHPPSCSGINSPRLFTLAFGAHRVLSLKKTLTMPPRRMSQRLHPDEGQPQESTNNLSLHQPSTQNLSTIAEYPEHPTFGDISKVQLHQPAHISTAAVGAEDWDEEAEEDEAAVEEEKLAIVQEEIERLRQERESILRRQTAVQHIEAHR
jgi:hypothetical protein